MLCLIGAGSATVSEAPARQAPAAARAQKILTRSMSYPPYVSRVAESCGVHAFRLCRRVYGEELESNTPGNVLLCDFEPEFALHGNRQIGGTQFVAHRQDPMAALRGQDHAQRLGERDD